MEYRYVQPDLPAASPTQHDLPAVTTKLSNNTGLGAFYAERGLQQSDPETAQSWRAQRAEAISELHFFSGIFLKSFFYEILPSFITGPVCIYLDGMNTARARSLWPPKLLLDNLLWSGTYFAAIMPWFSDGISGFNTIGTFILLVSRALTIAVKYALYGYRDVYDKEYGLKSVRYLATKRQLKYQMSGTVFNIGGHMRLTLVELLYQATLVKDTNLTVSTVHFDRAEDAMTLLAEVFEGLREIEESDQKEQKLIESMRAKEPQRKLSKKISYGNSMEKVGVGGEINIQTSLQNHKYSKHIVASKKTLSRSGGGSSNGGGSNGDSSSGDQENTSEQKNETKMLGKGVGLIHNLLHGMTRSQLEDMAKSKRLPPAIIALHCVWRCHYVSAGKGVFLFLWNMPISLVIAFLPAMITGASGLVAFGPTPMIQAINGSLIVPNFLLMWLIFFYAWCPCWWQICNLKKEAYLHSMLAGPINEHNVSRSSKIVSESMNVDGQKFSSPCDPPTLDLSVPDNVVAFASLRRVLHGASFAGVLQKRFSFYLVISFGTLVLCSGVQVVQSRLEDTETFSVGVKVQSTAQLLMVSMFIVIQGKVLFFFPS